MRISDWSSDVCSYDLAGAQGGFADQLGVGGNLHRRLDVDAAEHDAGVDRGRSQGEVDLLAAVQPDAGGADHILDGALRSEEHTSELQSLMRISYAVFCLKKKNTPENTNKTKLD